MKKWLRRIRGAIGTGLTWAAAWFGAGMIMLRGNSTRLTRRSSLASAPVSRFIA